MKGIINFFIEKYKATLLIFLLIFISGLSSYVSIPKESQPNIEIPYIWVDVYLDGVSPEDSEKLIVKPLENELKNIKNVIYYEGEGGEGYGWVFLEFEAGTDTQVALDEVREAVTLARSKLPPSAEEPLIGEFSMADENPVLDIAISGKAEERVLNKISDLLEEEIKALPEVLDVEIRGKRVELIDITLSSVKMDSYNLNQTEIMNFFKNNDQLIPAGSIDSERGNLSFKVSGSVDTLDEILNIPIKVKNNIVLKFSDIAEVKRVYKKPSSFSRLNGEKTITLSVKKRNAQNILDTVEKTKKIVEKINLELPNTIEVKYTYDASIQVQNLLNDLENNIVSSVLLVFIVILAALGFRTSLLVGFAIPGAFLMGIIALSLMGITLNMVVLFSLIMSIGMLVDGAIVVSEYADKKMQEGFNKKQAFKEAAVRMSMPIISSTATTLAAFVPLLFWSGTTGQFMIYLPITLIVTLSSSIFMALIFIPTIGSKFGKVYKHQSESETLKNLHNGDYSKLKGMEKIYYPFLKFSVNNPIYVLLFVSIFSVGIISIYSDHNNGVIFFPEGNNDSLSLVLKADGEYSIYEKNEMVSEVENEVLKKYSKFTNDIRVYASNSEGSIGRINLSLKDWKERPKSNEIADMLREDYKNYSGIIVEVREQGSGPSSGTDLEMELSSNNKSKLYSKVDELYKEFQKLDYLTDLNNGLPKSGMQLNFNIDREKAALFGTSLVEIGTTLQLLTNGLKITEYFPEDLDEEIDVRVRYNKEDRTLQTLETLTVNTNQGRVPLSTFVTLEYKPKVISIIRLNGMETIDISGNLKKDVYLDDKIEELKDIVNKVIGKDPELIVNFAGDQEEQDDTEQFLIKAFSIAIFMMFMILVAQFNSYYQTFIVMSAIIFSTMGVFALLLILGQPFGIVMGGIGVISLAGIVINNNIVLIDTFNEKIKEYDDYYKAVIETGVERFRPVFLTTITTVLGLLPMAMKLNINVFTGEFYYDSPSSQFWEQLAFSIMGGMTFSFFITLLVTPALLVVFKKRKDSKMLTDINSRTY